MPTNTKIITDALQKAQIIADGQTASASELADGLTELNQMMAMWAVDDMDIGYFPQDTGSDTCPIPIWAEGAVKANLTVALCAAFGVAVKPETLGQAMSGSMFIAKMVINSNLEGVDMDNMPNGTATTRWNINSGSF